MKRLAPTRKISAQGTTQEAARESCLELTCGLHSEEALRHDCNLQRRGGGWCKTKMTKIGASRLLPDILIAVRQSVEGGQTSPCQYHLPAISMLPSVHACMGAVIAGRNGTSVARQPRNLHMSKTLKFVKPVAAPEFTRKHPITT